MGASYSIGIDFGTLSARAILINIRTGDEIATSVYGYQDAVIDKYLPASNVELPLDYALQNPRDYEDALVALLSDIWKTSEVAPMNIRSIGIAFTACTVLPVDRKMQPLCYNDNFRLNPHSWVKLWKHHGAREEANQINETASRLGESFIKRYGNTSSSEWYFAKLLEVYRKSPEIYRSAYRFVNAADWVVWLLTGNYSTSSCLAGYKAFWSKEEGFPSKHFFKSIDEGFANVVEEKVNVEVLPVGTRAGNLLPHMAELTGLSTDTSVAVSMIDAHAGLPAVGITQEGSLLMVMGTSLCHILVSKQKAILNGISGVVLDGIIPGLYGYEAGQAAVGDIFDWFVTNFMDYELVREANEQNLNLFEAISEKAEALRPGENGLIALDWWNGNRSILSDSGLSGLVVGMTLATLPEELYRALIEATAFGTRMIIENFENNGVQIQKIYACGGLSRKSALIMQIFADILGKNIYVSNTTQTTAYGAAMYGMVALGSLNGGYKDIKEATEHLRKPQKVVYKPDLQNFETYSGLFIEYQKLHEYFGIRETEIMRNLRSIKEIASVKKQKGYSEPKRAPL